MKLRVMFLALVVFLFASACDVGSLIGGAKPVTVNDLPVYPGATELKAGDSRVGDTLAKNSQQITAMTKSIGSGGNTEQKGFTLPKDATWDAVKKFYDDKLPSSGWGDQNALVGNILSQVNTQNDAFQMAFYQRGNQNLSVIRVMMDPTTKDTMLIFSLATK